MSSLESLLLPGSTDLPDCRCGAEMSLVGAKPGDAGDTEVRIFRCDACQHELQLMVWREMEAAKPLDVAAPLLDGRTRSG
jgi:hypothetical protein